MTDRQELEAILNICAEEKALLRADCDVLREQKTELLETLEQIVHLANRIWTEAQEDLNDISSMARAAIVKAQNI